MPTFACQRCRQILRLPSSLSDDPATGGTLTQSAYDVIEAESLLLRQSPLQQRKDVPQDTPVSANFSPVRVNAKQDDIISSSKGGHNSLSDKVALTTSLFDLLSTTTPPTDWLPPSDSPLTPAASKMSQKERMNKARLPIGVDGMLTTPIDHPLCVECVNVLLSLMESQLEEVRRERDAYLAFEAELDRGEDQAESREEMTAKIKKLEIQSEETRRELIEARQEEAAVIAELASLDEEERKLEEEEKAFWDSHVSLSREASELSMQRSSLQASLAHDRAQLTRLQQTNVYNDVFCIGYEDGYGTINGLRLGQLQNDSSTKGGAVEWTEVNAAWGQTAFLLVTLARKCEFTFQDYKVIPMGSFSTVEKINGDRKEIYPLYGSSDWQFGLRLSSRQFDHAMIAFLDCLRQLCEHISTRDSSVKPPHVIFKDKIGGSSIRKSDERWTRALRNVLMTLKLLLSWVIELPDVTSSS